MNNKTYIKLPRLYIDIELAAQENIELDDEQSHYLKNVMRKKEGEEIRIFNSQYGEWLSRIETINKKSVQVHIHSQLRKGLQSSDNTKHVHLIFSPIKKDRLDFLIEKATELGVTHFHPVTMQNTQLSKIKTERIEKQIISAAEQCERLDIPSINSIIPFTELLSNWPEHVHIFAAIERQENLKHIQASSHTSYAFAVGPEGGFDETEIELLNNNENVSNVNLGASILRTETAVCAGLAILGS